MPNLPPLVAPWVEITLWVPEAIGTLDLSHHSSTQGNVVLSVITEFTTEFRTVIDGNTNDLSLNELSGGARISFVFHELFNNGVKSIDPFDQVKDGDIRTILYNSSGSTPVSGHAQVGLFY